MRCCKNKQTREASLRQRRINISARERDVNWWVLHLQHLLLSCGFWNFLGNHGEVSGAIFMTKKWQTATSMKKIDRNTAVWQASPCNCNQSRVNTVSCHEDNCDDYNRNQYYKILLHVCHDACQCNPNLHSCKYHWRNTKTWSILIMVMIFMKMIN